MAEATEDDTPDMTEVAQLCRSHWGVAPVCRDHWGGGIAAYRDH